jgi:sodium-dependent dicarboxylate transporter 2/3/5
VVLRGQGAAADADGTPLDCAPTVPRKSLSTWRLVALVCGPALGAATWLSAPPAGLSEPAWRVAGLAGWMVVWWLSEAVPIPATALLPIAVAPLAGVAPERDVAAAYAHPLIFLFLGGFILAAAMRQSGLHRRVALGLLGRAGSGAAGIVGGFMAATALLSMWISNTATAILMYTIATSLLEALGRTGERNRETAAAAESAAPEPATGRPPAGAADRQPVAGPSAAAVAGPKPALERFGLALMLGIAYAASIGGVATLVGTPTNALLASFLDSSYGYALSFRRWLALGLPFTIVMLPLAWLWLTRPAFRLAGVRLAGAAEHLAAERERLGPLSRPERFVAVVFALTAAAWVLRDLLARLTGWPLTDTAVAMLAGLVLLAVPVPGEGGRRSLDWAEVEKLPWGVLILFGGGLALAESFNASGLAAWIGGAVAGLEGVPPWLLVLAVTAAVVMLTEITSNTATAATFLPLTAAAAVGLGHSPLLLAVPVAIAASAAFMLPVATPPNAIVFGYPGMRISTMAKSGAVLNLLAIALITLLVLLLGGPLLGMD